MTEAARLFRPELVIAPFLRRAIPEAVWRTVRCLVVHPGPIGDRGPAALDWAILDGRTAWGTTLIEANADFDAGEIWATRDFDLRPATKSSHYRDEVTEAAVACVLEAIGKIERGVTAGRAFSRKRHRTAALGDQLSRSKSVPSTGRETTPRRCCASSTPPPANRAFPTRFSASPHGCTIRGRRTSCAGRRERSSPGAMAPSAARLSMARYGSLPSRPSLLRAPAASRFPRRWRLPAGSMTSLNGLARQRRRRKHLPRNFLPRGKRRRLAVVRIPQRSDVGRSMPPPARCLPTCGGGKRQGHRARRRA